MAEACKVKLFKMLGSIPPTAIYWMIVSGVWISYLFRLYLCWRQRRVLLNSSQIPNRLKNRMTPETFEKARLYEMDKINFSIVSKVYRLVMLTALLHYECIYKTWQLTEPLVNFSFRMTPNYPATVWNVKFGRNLCFLILAILFHHLVNLLVDLQHNFILEKKHGFNKQKLLQFQFANCAYFILTIPTFIHFTYTFASEITQTKSDVSYYSLWISLILFTLIGLRLLDHFFLVKAPYIHLYGLKVEPLRSRLHALATRVGFPFDKLSLTDVSGRTSHSSVGLYWRMESPSGMHIILDDTLIKGVDGEERGCNDDELEAIVAHQLSRWKLNHIWKGCLLNFFVVLNFALFVFGSFVLLYRHSCLYAAFGFPSRSDLPISFGVIVGVKLCMVVWSGCCYNVIRRRLRYESIAHVVDLGYGKQLKTALKTVAKDNLEFPIPDLIYSICCHQHPTLLEYITAINLAMSRRSAA
ncbi:CAAX prenyl protease 1 [Orchesella cincta]|uniref:CAAX prenyl protease 1 n=1 Tax=Orchesella cincta TaxID=48709 RepID=A0A1D2MWZ2_ORCCI|nr:CAAX prenyl protease 1 [Orchesella cincta]